MEIQNWSLVLEIIKKKMETIEILRSDEKKSSFMEMSFSNSEESEKDISSIYYKV